MKRIRSLILPLLVASTALSLGTAAGSSEPQPESWPRDFGAGVTIETTTPLAEIVGAPERYAGQPVSVEGRLSDLCVKKGCWTVLSDDGSVLRVRFDGYSFFLPQDALGALARIEGRTEIRTLSEREARHRASESRGEDPGAIDGPVREIGFVATGVRLLAPAP